MGCAMTKCKLLQCIRSRKPEGTITTTITSGPHSKPDHGRYFYFSSVYVARVRSGAADQKSSRGPGAALQGIHDFVQLQRCAETVRAAKVATSTCPCDNYSRFRRVGTMEGEAPRGTPATEKKDYESTVAGFWWSRMMPVRATILIPLSGPNPTAPVLSLFLMRCSRYRR